MKRLVFLLSLFLALSGLAQNPSLPVSRINRIAPPAGQAKTQIDGGLTFKNNADRIAFAAELGDIGAEALTHTPAVFANAAARTATAPLAVGQRGTQLDNSTEWRGTALTAGAWESLIGVTTLRSDRPVAHVAKSLRQRWEYRGVALAGGAGEPEVHYDSGAALWRMFYAINTTIYRATSTDGITFTAQGAVAGLSGLRTSLYVEGGTYYLYYSDNAVDPSGNIRLATSTDGVNFTAVGIKIAYNAIAGSNGWNSLHILKDGSTYRMLLEGGVGVGNTWRSFYLTATAPSGPWTFQNGEAPLAALNAVGAADQTDSTYSPGPIFKVGNFYHTFMHDGGWAVSIADDGCQIYHARSLDFLRWTRPRLMIDRADVPLISGQPTLQLADGTMVEVNGVVYFYCTQTKFTGGFVARVLVFTFTGSLADLVALDDADALANEAVEEAVATGRDVLQFDGDARTWKRRAPMVALEKLRSASTVTITGTLSPDLTGTFARSNASYPDRFIRASDSAFLIYNGSAWDLRTSGNVTKFTGGGTSASNPAGTYTATGGGTGTATVVHNAPTESAAGFFYGTGLPDFIAPAGSRYRRIADSTGFAPGAGTSIYVNETGTRVWTALVSTPARPRFQVAKGVNQNITAVGSWTKVTFPTVVADPFSTWDTTNNRWSPGVTGTVRVAATLTLSPNGGTADGCYLAFRKNGAFNATTRVVAFFQAGTAGFSLGGSAAFDCVPGDYFEVWLYCGANSVDQVAAVYQNFFDGEVVAP